MSCGEGLPSSESAIGRSLCTREASVATDAAQTRRIPAIAFKGEAGVSDLDQAACSNSKFLWTLVPQRRMTAGWIVKQFYVFKDAVTCLISRFKHLMMNEFLLQARQEALHHRYVDTTDEDS